MKFPLSEKGNSSSPEAIMDGEDIVRYVPQYRRKEVRVRLEPLPVRIGLSGIIETDGIPHQGLTALFITDGNGRAGGDYVEGAKKVVEIAKILAQYYPGQISNMIAWILSEDNIEKRSKAFFKKIKQAFYWLGINIVAKNELVSAGIKMDIAGDIEFLRQHGGKAIENPEEREEAAKEAAELADMIEAVCKLTHSIQNFRLTLKIGVGNHLGHAHVIVRSAAEKKGLFRNSGLYGEDQPKKIFDFENGEMQETYSPSVLVSFINYWPELPAHDVAKKIIAVRNEITECIYRESFGHNLQFLQNFWRAELASASSFQETVNGKETAEIITIPYHLTIQNSVVLQAMVKPYENWLKAFNRRVEIHDRGQYPFNILGVHPDHADRIYRFIPHDRGAQSQNTYDVILAVGQATGETSHMVIPATLLNGYTMFIPAGYDPYEVSDTLTEALDFQRNFKALHGAERYLEGSPNLTAKEFQRYEVLQQLLLDPQYSELPVEGVTQKCTPEQSTVLENSLGTFSKVADFFVAKMLLWAEKLKSLSNISDIFERLLEKLAFVNYAFTSFFLAYYPNHENWGQLQENWEQRAEFMAHYMGLVFLMDEHIFDALTSDQNFRKAAAPVLSKAIKGKPVDFNSIAHFSQEQQGWLQLVYGGYKELSQSLSQISHPVLYARWQEDMINLFEGSVREWDKETLHPPLVDALIDNYDSAFPEFEAKYLTKRMPQFLRKKIDLALSKIQGGSLSEKQAASYDLKQYLYFLQIEQTIGAKLTYMTLNCVNTKGLDLDPELLSDFEELGSLINFYYRAANDFAEASRGKQDQDNKPADTCSYMYEKYSQIAGNPNSVKFLVGSSVKTLLDELSEEIKQKQVKFFEKASTANRHWQYVALALLRTEFAMGFYKGTHYREARREKVEQLFNDNYHLVQF